MQARYKWLLLPPAIALILFMGPLRNVELPSVGGPAPETDAVREPQGTDQPETTPDPESLMLASLRRDFSRSEERRVHSGR